MQIIQFLFGGSYAALHSFVSYTIPIQVSSLADSAIEHTGYQTVSCINTSGQTFAIWFNVLYLAPLTVLFVRFFVKNYFPAQKGGKQSPATGH